MSGILNGVRVVDLTQMVAGPLCTLLLGDLGADIIKVEPPGGDTSRQLGRNREHGPSDYFLSLNRNKRSIVLDLKDPSGLDCLKALVSQADVVVENFRPGTLERLGLGYEDLKQIKPDLIYCALSGFGQEGAYRDKPALDPVIQAMSGIMQLTGTRDSGPLRSGMLIADFVPPLFGTIGILAALYERQRSGTGQRVDVSMLDATIFSMIPREGYYFSTGRTPERNGNAHYQISPWNTYQTSDERHLLVVAHTEKYWLGLLHATGLSELAGDARFASAEARLQNQDALDQLLAQRFLEGTLEHWSAIFDQHDVLFAPVRDFDQVFADPEVKDRLVAHVSHPQAGDLPVLRSPIRMSGQALSIRTPPPELGEHSAEILAEITARTSNT